MEYRNEVLTELIILLNIHNKKFSLIEPDFTLLSKIQVIQCINIYVELSKEKKKEKQEFDCGFGIDFIDQRL